MFCGITFSIPLPSPAHPVVTARCLFPVSISAQTPRYIQCVWGCRSFRKASSSLLGSPADMQLPPNNSLGSLFLPDRTFLSGTWLGSLSLLPFPPMLKKSAHTHTHTPYTFQNAVLLCIFVIYEGIHANVRGEAGEESPATGVHRTQLFLSLSFFK